MAKQGGLGDQLYIDGYNLSGDIGSLSSIHGGPALLDFTAIDKSAMERVGALRDGGIAFNAFFNPSANQAHPRLDRLPLTDVMASYLRGSTLGGAGAACIAKQINYDGKRGNDGSFTLDTNLEANGFGLEWGYQLTAGTRSDTTATNGTGVDLVTVSTAFGWQAYLQVFSFTGTSVTVTVQDSADNVSFANLTGGAFTAATGITTQRLASGATDTVRRYVRAITTGTFSQASFAVLFMPNTVATAF